MDAKNEILFMKQMKHSFIYAILILYNSTVFNQNSNILNDYIQYGIDNNLALKQKYDSYEKSLYALKEAKGLFYPSVTLNARYTVAQGGRIIEFPVGDMLNDVYSTLNMLTGTQNFPTLENMEFPFYRGKEQETKLSLVQPLYKPQLYYNEKIKSELAVIEKYDADSYKRQLISEIKIAYFNYLKTIQLNELISRTSYLLKENIRVNEKLFENGMVTKENLYRSQTELSKLNQQQSEIEKNINVSKAYFNFLLNKPLDSDISFLDTALTIPSVISLETAWKSASDNREELEILNNYLEISKLNIKLNRSEMKPSVFAVADYGFQGEKYDFSMENSDFNNDFLLASVVLQWTLFKGNSNKAKVQQAKLDSDILTDKKKQANEQIRLEVMNAHFELKGGMQNIILANNQLKTSKEAFKMVNRKYEQGQTSLLEYIDSRTEMTNAEMNAIIARYDFFIKYAEYERSACLYEIK